MLKELAQSARLNSFNAFTLFLIALISRVIAVFFITDVNADAVSRVFISLNWLSDPHLISSGTWAPLHFYIIAPVIWIFGDHILAPIFINVVLGSLTVPLVYRISKELYDHQSAVISALLFCFMPIVFRQHMMVLGGTPFVFFTALSIYYLIRTDHLGKDIIFGIYAGLFYTIAAGIRFEAWILMPVIAGIVLFNKEYQKLIAFMAAGMIFPTFWMIGNYLAQGDPLFSIHSSAEWNHLHTGIHENVSEFDYYVRSYFLPVLFLLNLTPLLFFILAIEFFRRIYKKEFNLNQLLWMTPALYLFVIFQYKTIIGDLDMHPRYIYTIMFFVSLHMGIIRMVKRSFFLPTFLLIIAANFLFSFKIHQSSIEDPFRLHQKSYDAVHFLRSYVVGRQSAIPRIAEEHVLEINEIIANEITQEDGLLVDFDTWENTYSIVLNSGKYGDKFYIINWNVLRNSFRPDEVLSFFRRNENGLFVTIADSKLNEKDLLITSEDEMTMIGQVRLGYKLIYTDDKYRIYRYTLLESKLDE